MKEYADLQEFDALQAEHWIRAHDVNTNAVLGLVYGCL